MTISSTRSAVPTGTVLLVAMTLKPFMFSPTVRATEKTAERSAEPSAAGGVPTAMKTTSAPRIASATSVEKRRRPALALAAMSVSSPGS